ncbi:MAG TPA: glycosyltransferase [Planctomycetota bacterium]|nr:glycosyltransferase [Planctomycetota bacterium]
MNVSVIVVNFNGGEWTPACLDSIPRGVETVVVDNGSRDGSADAIGEKYPWVTLLRNSSNLGFARAVNRGIEASHGRYVCLLNNDARLSPDTLSTLAAYLDAHPDAGMAAPQLLHEDGRKQHSFDNCPSLATAFLNKSLLRLLSPGKYPSKRQEVQEPRDVESVIGACMMVRRDLIDRIGPLDERYFLFLEETDWCLRSWKAGARVVFVPASTVVHLQGKTRDQARVRGRIEYTRSLFRYFRKNCPRSYPILHLLYPVKTLVEFLFQTLGLFLPRVRRRWIETAALLGWHVCFSPRSWGLSAGVDPRFMTLRDGTRVLEDHAEAFNEFDNKRRQTKVIKDLTWKRTLEYAAGARSYFIKIYKAPVWTRRVKNFLFGSRARKELECSLGVHDRGIPQAPVVAMREDGSETWVAIEKLGDWAQLQATLLSSSDRRALCTGYGRFARRLHDAGIWQYDFNPTNILVRDGRFLLIDFELMKLYDRAVPEGLRVKSLGKLNRVPSVSKTDRLRFLLGYLDTDQTERREWKSAARAILGHYAAQMDHDLERVERRCLDENRDFGAFESGEWRGHYLKKREGRPGGLTLDEARTLANGGEAAYRVEPASNAIAEWQKANQKAKEGGTTPVAVLVRRTSGEGKIAFPKA